MSSASSPNEPTAPSYEQLRKDYSKLEQEHELVKFELEQLKQQVFGRKSEKHYPESPEQEQLFENGAASKGESEEEFVEVSPFKRKRRSKKSIPKELPVVEEIHRPKESNCPDCGQELLEYSRDVREELEFEPARFFKRQHITVHCSCPKCRKSESGQVPSKYKPVIPGACIGAGFLAHLITSRICDHLPYYRQSKIYEREGVYLPDKALSRYGLKCAALLEPIAKAIKAELLKKGYLQADETHLDVLDGEKEANIHTGQVWVLHDPLSSLVYYEYHPGRTQGAATALLDDFSGALQSDAYVCYNEHKGLRIGCMATLLRLKRLLLSLQITRCI